MFAKHVSAFPSWVAAPMPPTGHDQGFLGLAFIFLALAAGTVLARIRAGPSGGAMAFARARSITPRHLLDAFSRGILNPKIYSII